MALNTTRMTDTEKNELIERLTDEVMFLSDENKRLQEQLIHSWNCVERQAKTIIKSNIHTRNLIERNMQLLECVEEQNVVIEAATDFIQATAQPESLITED
jgi:hypothetical protein